MLTKHQREKLDQALEILRKSDRLLISGSAGVGKTYLVDTLIQEYLMKNPYHKVVCTAPTHKAVAVLRSKITSLNNSEISLSTTQSALKLKRVIDFKTGNISFVPNFSSKYPPLKNVNLLVIDEASMISEKMLEHIEIHATTQKCKVIFIGDDKQINPVGEEDSPVFLGTKDFEMGEVIFKPFPTVELTEIIRQGDSNPIIDLSRNLEAIKDKTDNLKILSKEGYQGYLHTEDYEKIIRTLSHINGSDKIKYLAWTNKEVDKINSDVRRSIYSNPAKVEVGETLVFNSPLREDYFTDQEIYVDRVLVRKSFFEFKSQDNSGVGADIYEKVELEYYSINYKVSTEFTEKDSWKPAKEVETKIKDDIMVIHENSEVEFKKVSEYIKKKAKTGQIPWVDYYNFIEQFADLKYNHAITVHKSQGSTFNEVIINVKDINFNRDVKERTRLLYTAITRARNLVIFYKS